MDTNLLREKLLTFAKENIVVVGLGIVGLIFLGYGLISLLSSDSSKDEIIFESFDNASDKPSEQVSKIVVDVEGGVEKPGVYSLSANSRVQDALIAAGGLSESANREWVTKNLNLAAKVTDGGKIYIPLQGESITPLRSSSFAGQAGGVNINTASESELDTLPGVGPVTAQKIINGRPYSLVEELVQKKVVSNAVFEKIKDKISL